MHKHWVVFFSQTGSEINELRKAFKRDPDLIITNRTNLIGVSSELLRDCLDKFVFIPRKPSENSYKWLLEEYAEIFSDCICTLHGFLRVLPEMFCEALEGRLYNGHPGQILDYPELKGFNAQQRAWEGGYKTAGSVVHEVTAGVDEGRVLAHHEISIEGMTLDEVYENLHTNSINLWIEFLKDKM